ncbi:hypothetical protein VB005_00773 [Metarhizium brunneum]
MTQLCKGGNAMLLAYDTLAALKHLNYYPSATMWTSHFIKVYGALDRGLCQGSFVVSVK